MFSKTKTSSLKNPGKSKPGGNRAASSAGPSIISADLTVVGNLKSKGEIQIDGAVEGIVVADSILLTRGGRVLGELRASSIAIHGRIKGRVEGGRVHLYPQATVEGDIINDSITIDEGAQFTGQISQKVGGKNTLKSISAPIDETGAASASWRVVDSTAEKSA